MDNVCYLWRSEMCAIAFPEMKNRKIMGYSKCYYLSDVKWPDKQIVQVSNYSSILKNNKKDDINTLISQINNINIQN